MTSGSIKHGQQSQQDERRAHRDLVDEPAEVQRRVDTGEIGQRTDDQPWDTERCADLSQRAALHLDGETAELVVQAAAGALAMEVLIAGQDGAVADPRWPVSESRGSGQRRQGNALEVAFDPIDEFGPDRLAQAFGRLDEGHMSGLTRV